MRITAGTRRFILSGGHKAAKLIEMAAELPYFNDEATYGVERSICGSELKYW